MSTQNGGRISVLQQESEGLCTVFLCCTRVFGGLFHSSAKRMRVLGAFALFTQVLGPPHRGFSGGYSSSFWGLDPISEIVLDMHPSRVWEAQGTMRLAGPLTPVKPAVTLRVSCMAQSIHQSISQSQRLQTKDIITSTKDLQFLS